MNKFSKYTVIEYQNRVVRFTVFTIKQAFFIYYVRNMNSFHIKVGEWKIK